MSFHILIEVKVRLDDGPYMMLVTGKQMSGTEFPENCPQPEMPAKKTHHVAEPSLHRRV
ncbi:MULTISPECIES: hypothetical protein [Rhizobium/Agrobacterium group]|uniref:hypothetical protein n=1 Tax=Rhizobium/Agrobacterium group TaxID=227290 RepID=UPI0022BFF6FE|nr:MULTISPECIES: hypothetical protein [Rhizobium/Agrobacterium group]MCZ7480616.1 hypothetical protein [Rhizobium rhizogenes]MDA5634962.1 hypothetical protein [Agrobacterium sp. ST15.16.024]MDF1890907.1 hypothetical protein [Rhizobium rhizogenes]